MSLLELQVGAAPFLVAQRNYLRTLALCPPALPAVDGVQVVVDRVDVGSSLLRHGDEDAFPVFMVQGGEVVPTPRTATGRPVLLEQRLTLRLTTEDDIRAHPNASPRLVPVGVVLRFVISADTLQDECYLRARLDAVDVDLAALPAPLPAHLPAAAVARIQAFLTTQARLFAPSGTVAMGLAGLRSGITYLNAGLALDPAAQTLAIRVQVGGSRSDGDVAWSTFYAGGLPDRRQGADWSLFVEAGYLTESAKALLGASLPRDADLDAYPGCTYRVEDGGAVLDVSALLIYHAVEVQELGLDLTVEAHPHVLLRPSVAVPGRLRIDVDFARITEVQGFVSSFALSVTRLFGIPVEEMLLRLIGSVAVDGLRDAGADARQTSPTTIRVEQAIEAPTVPGSVRTEATRLLALPDGIAIAGTMSTTELTTAVPLVEIAEFRIAVPRVSCGPASLVLVAAFLDDPAGFRVLRASAAIRNLGTAPLRLCRPPTVDRIDGPVTTADLRLETGQPPMDLRVDVAAPDAAYYADPYPVDVVVATSGGTRLLRFAPLPVIDGDRYQGLAAELLAAIADCQQLVDPWLRTHRGYNPRWSPRPPEDGSRVVHLWEVEVAGLPAGQAARLDDRRGRLLVEAVSAGGPVHLTAVVSPSASDREVVIRRVDGPQGSRGPDGAAPTVDPAAGGLQVRQTNLVVEGVVNLPGRAGSISSVVLDGGPAVVALLADRAVAYTAWAASPAAATASWAGRFTGMLASRRSLLLYGPGGLASVDRSGRLTRTAVDVPVQDAALGPDGVYALTGDRVLALSPSLEVRAELPAPGAVAATHTRGRLVVAVGHAVEVVGGEADARRAATGEAAVTALAHVPFLDAGALLATLDDDSARVLVAGDDGVRETARYAAAPWFAAAVRMGDRVVRLSDSRDRLELYRVGTSVAL